MKTLPIILLCLLLSACGSSRKSRNSKNAQERPEMMSVIKMTPELAEEMRKIPEMGAYLQETAVAVNHPLLNPSTFLLTVFSKDKTYGYSESNPICVGGVSLGPINEFRFLNALAGPEGEVLTFERLGSCCPFQTANSPLGMGLLDKYKITYEGAEKEVFLYLNMYDEGPLEVPVGFSLRLVF